MADLAGFDVIGEIHMETIVDLINLRPITNPVDGSSIYLLGGPVSADLSVDLGPLGVVTVRAILDATLQAVIHQPLARFVISLTGSSTAVAGRALSHIGGQVTVTVPLAFQISSGVPTPPVIPAGTPVFLLGAGSPSCVLNGTTRTMADATLGNGGLTA